MRFLTLFLMLLALLVVTSNSFAADTATVSGQIKDANGKPVSNATVSIGDKSDITDADGRYRLKDVPVDEQRIKIQKNRKLLKEDAIDIKESGANIEVSIP